jgi:hypothetical protein
VNAESLYTSMQQENDRLLNLKHRVRTLTERICGPAPREPLPASSADGKPLDNFLDQCGSVMTANIDLVYQIEQELTWLESFFNLGQAGPETAYPTSGSARIGR